MLALPIPLVVSAVLGLLLVRSLLNKETHPLLQVLIAACAVQGLIVALHQYYGISMLRWVQPVMAAAIPAIAWVAFVASTQRPLQWPRDLRHVAGPLLVAMALLLTTVSPLLDLLIPALFAGYGIALLRHPVSDSDGLPLARLESGDLPMRLWQLVGWLLIASAVSDGLIAVAQATGAGSLQPLIISIASSLNLLILGTVSLARDIGSSSATVADDTMTPMPEDAGDPPMAIEPAAAAALIGRLDQLMRGRRLYLDPDLSLSQLARKLGVPAKQLSAAINRHCGENVSRHINGYRIEHACELLRENRSVTSVAFDSGFNTKSNFNREFLRLRQSTPSQWQQQQVPLAGRAAGRTAEPAVAAAADGE